MWYEILPSCGIIFVALMLPHGAAIVSNKLFLGNVSFSNLEKNYVIHIQQYQYIVRIVGSIIMIFGSMYYFNIHCVYLDL